MFNQQLEIMNKRPVYLYLNNSNEVAYCDFKESFINIKNNSLKRYVIKENYLRLFIKTYNLRLHPEALLNVTK
jgi:hypothetical protein